MNIKQIIGFNALAKVLNFSKAADSVYLTQPAFSRMIQSLEEELGGQLFVRSKTSPQLTVLGAQVLPEFQEMERHYENILKSVHAQQASCSSKIIFGTFETGIPDFIYHLCDSFSCEEKEVIHFSYPEYSESTAYEALAHSEIDVLYTAHVPNALKNEVNMLTLESHITCAYVNKNHPLARKEKVSFRELENETFIVVNREKSPLGFNRLLEMTIKAGFSPKSLVQSSTLPGIKSYIQGNDGISVLPAGIISAEGICSVPINDADATSTNLIWMKSNSNRALEAFVRYCQQYVNL